MPLRWRLPPWAPGRASARCLMGCSTSTRPSSTVIVDRFGEPLYEVARRRWAARRVDRRRRDPGVLADATIAAEDRDSAAIPASIRAGDRESGVAQRSCATRGRRWVDDHAAGRGAVVATAGRDGSGGDGDGRSRREPATDCGARLAPAAVGSGDRAAAGASALEGRDPRALSEPGALREPDRGRRARPLARTSAGRFVRRSITPAEAAYLAALPQQPSRFNPWRRPDAPRAAAAAHPADDGARRLADARGDTRRRRESACRFITRSPTPSRRTSSNVCWPTSPAQTPRRIETTLDRTLAADRARHHRRASRRRSTRTARRTSPSSVLDNHRAEWLAWEGSGNYFDTGTAAPSTASSRLVSRGRL